MIVVQRWVSELTIISGGFKGGANWRLVKVTYIYCTVVLHWPVVRGSSRGLIEPPKISDSFPHIRWLAR